MTSGEESDISMEVQVLKTVKKSPKNIKKDKVNKADKPRLTWSQKDTCSLLESLVVMASEQFNPNDTNEWLQDENIEILKAHLVERKVNKNWWTNISGETDMAKCRKKYTNLKANYVAQQKTDKYSTGGGTVKSDNRYTEYMDKLVGSDNPISNPDLVIDDGQAEAATPSGTDTLSSAAEGNGRKENALTRRNNRPPTTRDQMYSSVTSLMQCMVNGNTAPVQNVPAVSASLAVAHEAEFSLRTRQVDLDTMKFLDGKSMDDIVEIKKKLAYLKALEQPTSVAIVVPVPNQDADDGPD